MDKRQTILVILAVVITPALRAHAQWLIPRLMDPTTYTSPTGQCRFYVGPTDRYGSGPADCRLSRGGRQIWKRRLAFTPTAVDITDKGIVCAVGYRGPRVTLTGPLPFSYYPIYNPQASVEIAIFDPRGKALVDDKLTRTAPIWHYRGHAIPGVPNPLAPGVICDGAGNRIIVRLSSGRPGNMTETWHVYRLSTGHRIADVTPPGSKHATIAGVRPVAGTPFIAIHWIDGADARYGIVDSNNRLVWSRTYGGVYKEMETAEFGEIGIDWLMHGEGIRPTPKPHQLTILSPTKMDQTVDFAITRSRSTGQWDVKEVGRHPFTLDAQDDTAWKKVPVAKLKLLGAQKIPTVDDMSLLNQPAQTPTPAQVHALNIIGDVQVTADGSIYVLDNITKAVHRFDSQMRELTVFAPPQSLYAREVRDFDTIVVAPRGDIYIQGRFGDNAVRLHFSPDHTFHEEQSSPRRPATSASSTGLTWLTSQDSVDVLDSDGRLVRHVDRDADGTWMRKPEAIAVAPDGSAAVIDADMGGVEMPIHLRLSLYSATGNPIGTVPSKFGWGSLAYDGTRIFLANMNGVFCIDKSGHTFWRLPVEEGMSTSVFLTDHGRVLTLFTNLNEIRRYAMP